MQHGENKTPEQERTERHEQEAFREQYAVNLVKSFVEFNADILQYIAHWGAGRCEFIQELFAERLIGPDSRPDRAADKEKISASLRKRVFERDAYRCQHCGGWEDLCADHVIPESKGGATTEENLQTLCGPCNRAKGAKEEG